MFSDKYGNLTNIWPSQLATVPVPPTGPTISGAGLVGYGVPDNTSSAYGPTPAGVLKVDNSNSISNHPPLSNFAPRFGLAWQPMRNGKLVVRAGFGLFYDRVWADSFVHGLQQNPPYGITISYGKLVVRAGFGLFYDRVWADSFAAWAPAESSLWNHVIWVWSRELADLAKSIPESAGRNLEFPLEQPYMPARWDIMHRNQFKPESSFPFAKHPYAFDPPIQP